MARDTRIFHGALTSERPFLSFLEATPKENKNIIVASIKERITRRTEAEISSGMYAPALSFLWPAVKDRELISV